ncbi:hypothetical protein BLA13014_07603 [Burkholderia aenigmatica]|uniref:Uncharacterized protein n=1 Tax=Burkholderia aenigmatica TaxID=2015348 RepID=A0A6P2T0X0_9BURK|nr:hypothetical protein [Burkholderia aenigmatica]VWC49533.1 hypothetical protein BLA13014_07603 [Burkholderia aenigmatica]
MKYGTFVDSNVIAVTTTEEGHPLWLETRQGRDTVFLDCGTRRNGDRHYLELPRGFKTARGARQAAALMLGERLTWRAPD